MNAIAPAAARWRCIAGASAPAAFAYDADIVILALDRPAETGAAIASALAQRGVSRHLWIVDQGSTADNLARLAAAIAGRADATLIALERNLGVAGGRDLGNRLGRGRVIATLDNDAAFAGPATLAGAVGALDADPGLAALGFRILRDDSGTDDLGSWGYPAPLLARAAECFDAATFVGAGHAIRRAAWDDAGGYDPALFFCWEELDFCLRAIDRGWRVRYRGDLVVRHRVAAEHRVRWSEARWFYFVRNRLYIARKWNASPVALLARWLGYVLKGLRHGLLRSTLRAWPAAAVLARAAPKRRLSAVGRDYLHATDRAPRGTLATRLRNELLGRLHAH